MDLLELQSERGKLITQMREINDRGVNSSEHEGFANAEDRSQYLAIEKDLDTLEKRIARVQKIEADDRQAAQIQFEAGQVLDTKKEAEIYQRAFDKWVRFQEKAEWNVQERAVFMKVQNRAAGTGSDAAGGALVSRDLFNEVDKALKAYGGVYSVARILNTGKGNTLDFPTNDDTANKSTIVAESADIGDGTDLVFGKVTLASYKLNTGWIRVPFELTEDSEFNVGGFVMEAITERNARGANTYLTTGTGSSQPQGVVTGSSAGVTAAATAITADNLLDLQHSVNSAYRSSPSFRYMFNDSTLAAIRKLKDSNNNYIWQMHDIRTGQPGTVWGVAYVINDDMASIGANAKSVLCGDFSKYLVRNVGSPRLVRTDELFKGYDQVGYTYFSRIEGKILNSAAIKRITHAAS